MRTRWIIAAIAGLVGVGLAILLRPSEAQPERPGPPIRVLFIGNSYTETNNLPGMIAQLARQDDRPLEVEMVVRNGYSLDQHWQEGAARAAIEKGDWDYVVLQDQSEMPLLSPDKTIESGMLFGEVIRKVGAKPLLFVTWTKKYSSDQQQPITDTYIRLAQEIDARLVPVGPVWVDVGRGRVVFYRPDESHPTPLGTYVAALVFYAVIYDRSPLGLPLEGIVTEPPFNERPTQEIERFQELAWEAAQKLSVPPPKPPKKKKEDE